MTFSNKFLEVEPIRSEIDALNGPAVLEFGADGCGYCRDAQPLIKRVLSAHPDVLHIKVEDGRGRLLGRSFGVKLWPTLVFLKDGKEVARLIRPDCEPPIEQAVNRIERRTDQKRIF